MIVQARPLSALLLLITLATMVLAGWLMGLGGVVEAGRAFTCTEWTGFFLDVLIGILYPSSLLPCRIVLVQREWNKRRRSLS